MIFKEEKVVVRNTNNSNMLTGTIFQEIKRSGQLRSCFPYDKNMYEIKSFTEIMQKHNHLYAVYYKNLLCGAVWINSWEFKTARLTFSAFKTTARLHFYDIMKETARQLINLKGDDNYYCYDSLYGLVEGSNKSLIRASRLSGLKKTGFIPNFYGENKDVVILSITR
jgi:hypothetical protein